MGLAAVLLTGLTAGGLTCSTVQGGLLAAVATRTPCCTTGCATGTRLRADAVPVVGFLAGKLASHTALGAVLGGLGAAVRLPIQIRGDIQIAVGAAVALLGLGLFRRIPPDAPSDRPRHTGRAPLLAGLGSVALPCGTTLAMEALAATSGSAGAGAAVMAAFVIGTWPLFLALGLAARRLAAGWRGRLRLAAGALLVVLGGYTVTGGLAVAGEPTDGVSPGAAPSRSRQAVEITVSGSGYAPTEVHVPAGAPVTLILHSRHVTGCLRGFTLASRGVDATLPADGDTTLDLGVPAPGVLRYSCAMGMYSGRIMIG